jgi:hypothetical protein
VVTVGVDGADEAEARAEATARRLAGVASVALLDPDAVPDFEESVGSDLSVWGGAVRVYLPGADSDEMPLRHFFLSPAAIGRESGVAGRIILDRLATSIAARRAPDEYESVRQALTSDKAPRSVEELEQLWDEAAAETDRLRGEAKAAEDERILTLLEMEDVERDNEHLRGRLVYTFGQQQDTDALSDDEAGAELPDTAEDPSDAVRLARKHLTMLAVPEAATTTTPELDGAMEASVWGRKTWQALRALHLYALNHTDSSGFWEWCERSGHPFAWPASERKLAMSESDTAMTKYRDDRLFGIDPRVRGDEKQLMEAHIKVSNGGGQLTPRIYFYDDTKGVTGKVHIGFIGPHRYLRNAGEG